MRLEFQLRSADFEEANDNHVRFRHWMLSWVVGSLALSSLVSAVVWPEPSVPADVSLPAARGNAFLMFLPWAFPMALTIGLLIRMGRSQGIQPWKRRYMRSRATWRGWPWLAFGSLAVSCAVLAPTAIREKTASTIASGYKLGRDVSPTADVIVPLVPIATLMVLAAWLLPRTYRGHWAVQQHMHRPWVAEVSEDYLRLSEPLSTLEYRWGCFPGFIETPNIFVLYVAPHLFHMIPKRSFAEETQVAAFRELLARVIHEPLRAFPVLPPPLPPVAPPRTDNSA